MLVYLSSFKYAKIRNLCLEHIFNIHDLNEFNERARQILPRKYFYSILGFLKILKSPACSTILFNDVELQLLSHQNPIMAAATWVLSSPGTEIS